MEEKKRSKIEYVVIFVILAVSVLLIASNIYYKKEDQRQQALLYELQNIRTGINLFVVFEKRNPVSLADLTGGAYRFSDAATDSRYLTGITTDQAGNMIDVFGNEFIYDPSTGWVKSSTKGYEAW